MDEEESDWRQGVNSMSSSYHSKDKLSDFISFVEKTHLAFIKKHDLK